MSYRDLRKHSNDPNPIADLRLWKRTATLFHPPISFLMTSNMLILLQNANEVVSQGAGVRFLKDTQSRIILNPNQDDAIVAEQASLPPLPQETEDEEAETIDPKIKRLIKREIAKAANPSGSSIR